MYKQSKKKEGIFTNQKKNICFASREALLQKLRENGMEQKFLELDRRGQKEFMDFCTGSTMLPLTYDKVFKKIFNFERTPKRLEHFLSAILGFEVEILRILPIESEQMNEQGSILIMDIVVKTK